MLLMQHAPYTYVYNIKQKVFDRNLKPSNFPESMLKLSLTAGPVKAYLA